MHVLVVVRAREPHKQVPDVQVLVTHCVNHYGDRSVAVLLLPGKGFWALDPSPVDAVDRAHAAWQATGRVAREDVLQLPGIGTLQVYRFSLFNHKLRQKAGVNLNGGAGKATVLVSAVKGLSIPKHPQRGRHLLNGMGLRATGGVDSAPPHGLVADSSEQTAADRPWQAKTLLKRVLAVHRRRSVHTKLLSQTGMRTYVKIAKPLWATAWTGASNTLVQASGSH